MYGYLYINLGSLEGNIKLQRVRYYAFLFH